MQRDQPLELRSATRALHILERRFTRAPHEILLISEDATNGEACLAFVELYAVYNPRRFAELGEPLHDRAKRAFRRLRQALREFTATRAYHAGSESRATGSRNRDATR